MNGRARGPLGAALALAAACAPPTGAPPAEPPPAAWLEEVAAERGLTFRHESGHAGPHLIPEITCGGAALFDMDDDGDLDAYLVQFGGVRERPGGRPPNRLFRNLGGGRFEDVTDGSGADHRGRGNGVACGDYDGDGDVDLYVTNTGPNALLRNDGGGRFTDVSAAAGVDHAGWGTSAAFLDHDRDGDLDLFVANYLAWSPAAARDCPRAHGGPDYCMPSVFDAPAADVLYRNDGDGTFTDVTVEAGLGGALGTGLGVLAADFDGDGWTDVFVANDGMLDRLWRNSGDGRFGDVALEVGCAVDEEGHAKAGMGVAAADIDGDDDLEILIGNLSGETDSYFRNELGPRGAFVDATARSGLGIGSRSTRFGLGFADFDADSWLDLFEATGRVSRPPRVAAGDPYAEPNLLLRGLPGGRRFEEVLPVGGTSAPLVATSRGAAFGDVDDDGGVDVLVVNRDGPAHLLRAVAPRGHWLRLDLRAASGSPIQGAIVRLTAGGRRLRRDALACGSYQSSSDPRVHVGLGAARRATDVTVAWPGGPVESFGDLDADRTVRLVRGTGRPRP